MADNRSFSPHYTLSQPRYRPILSPDQQQHATANSQPDVPKKKVPPPRPRREERFHSPPPILPARNPLRSPTGAILPPHMPLRVVEIWDPEIGNYVKRLPEGGFGGVVDGGIAGSFGNVSFGGPNARRMPNGVPILRPGMEVAMRDGTTTTATGSQAQGIGHSRSVNDGRINNDNAINDTTSLLSPTPRLLNSTAIDRPTSHPSASEPGQEFSRTIHERIGDLRQTYINSLHTNEFETEFRTDGEAEAFTDANHHPILVNRAHPSTSSTPPPPPPPLPLPTTPLHRTISNPSASSQASARNFSLPSYGSPSAKEEKQQQHQQQSALASRSVSGPLQPQQQQQQHQFALESRSMSGPLPLPSSFHHSPSAHEQQQQQPFELEAYSISGPLPLPSTSSRWDLRVENVPAMVATPTTPVQNTPRRPLRRVRSRSVDLGRISEAREVPRMRARRLGWWDEIEEEAVQAGGVDDGKVEKEGTGHETGIEQPEAGTVARAAKTTATKPKRKIWKEVEEVEEELVEEAEEVEEEACGRCKSIRRALARNPLCCVDRTRFHRLCFKCWSEALAEGLKSEEREKWLCCVVCGRELLFGDAKRLASRGTILR
jgi:hypothetical protein